MTSFVINTMSNAIVGCVSKSDAIDLAPDTILVSSGEELEQLQIVSNVKNLMIPYFEAEAMDKMFFNMQEPHDIKEVSRICYGYLSLLMESNPEKFLNLNPEDESEIKATKPRKIRNSKLQRMATAFKLKNDDGTFKKWSIEELMTQSGVSKKIAGVYISILRSQSDRFRMSIEKDITSGLYSYSPK